ncbi:MAG TPA: multicopper oxidase family protein [Vicinamibacterales bacterium]|nr:multicopper oxidase family protein [Vicinamibacterales bacterium]
MTRRELFAAACGWTTASAIRGLAQDAGGLLRQPQAPEPASADADITLRIGEVTLELAPRRTVRTLAYNGQVPGPLLRAKRSQRLRVDVWNDAGEEELVHWHGFHIPPEVDGSYEEGTPGVPGKGGRRRYVFTAEPAGTRWYHSHTAAGRNLRKSTYTGQFGMFIVESADPGAYDLEVPLLLHEWDPHFNSAGDVEFRLSSINGKMLGAGDPIRVRQSQRVLFRIVNASATLAHRLALPGHLFEVIALDGNPVPTARAVSVIELGPGERVDALVEMNRPGVWILGELIADQRAAGLGIVVEYAGQPGPPRWESAGSVWNYGLFGAREPAPEPDSRAAFVFKSVDDGHRWTINGKSYPKTDPIVVSPNRRYRWRLDNQSSEPHPMHLHRHAFEIVRFDGQPISGIRKDVVVVPAWKQVEIDVVTDQPGLSLFHCHQQFHMDMGFMAVMQYGS